MNKRNYNGTSAFTRRRMGNTVTRKKGGKKKRNRRKEKYFEAVDVNRKLYHALLRRGLDPRLPIHPRRGRDYGNTKVIRPCGSIHQEAQRRVQFSRGYSADALLIRLYVKDNEMSFRDSLIQFFIPPNDQSRNRVELRSAPISSRRHVLTPLRIMQDYCTTCQIHIRVLYYLRKT